ncbi:MAG: methyltransferase domain-containing protein, partial [Actinomycetota bacterium]
PGQPAACAAAEAPGGGGQGHLSTSTPTIAAPIRDLPHQMSDGVRILSRPGARPGAPTEAARGEAPTVEERLLGIVAASADPGSLSDGLEAAAGPDDALHVSRSRANLLRPLQLTPALRVLELGAGYGALTRYLGETCASVDAVERVPARASVARARTRDLPGVEVFAGTLDDVPTEPFYDVVTAVGLPERADGGSPGPAGYDAFLAGMLRRLKPGGTLVLALPNRLGIKYLCGHRDDHTGRPFDGLEGYPHGGGCTLSRGELERMLRAAGLAWQVLTVFPDHLTPRALLSDELLGAPALGALAKGLPGFPSPGRAGHALRLAVERRVWGGLVDAGIAAHFGNALLVVASRGEGSLWPDDLLAAFYSLNRRALFTTASHVASAGDGVRIRRRRLAGPQPRVEEGPLALEVGDADFVDGEMLVDVISDAAAPDREAWLARWAALVAREAREGRGVDLLPANIVVDAGGDLHVIDQEWSSGAYGPDEVLSRGALLLTLQLWDRILPERWDGAVLRDVAVAVGRSVGLDVDGSWLAGAIAREADLQAQVQNLPPDAPGFRDASDAQRRLIEAGLANPLSMAPGGVREHELRATAEIERQESWDRTAYLFPKLHEATAQLEAARTELRHSLLRAAQLEGEVRALRNRGG